jgi:sigma-54 dependent transcriptional regulator, acetoin dehydrogenase operon transcriptional activator AcoR
MGDLQFAAIPHDQRLHRAREAFFDLGNDPEDLIDRIVVRSWERCRRFGLEAIGSYAGYGPVDRAALIVEQDRNRLLLTQAQPIMEHVYQQIRASGSMVLLAGADGLLLHSVGDPDFVDRAGRVALSPGASWDEGVRGTNAIGTALAEEVPTEILGSEHYLEKHAFLTCSASPIFGPDGRPVGVLDISGDYRSYQRHTLGLARMSAQLVEKRLFETIHARDLLLHFHLLAEYLGSPAEGMAALSPDGRILAINQNGLDLLGLRRVDVVKRDFSMIFTGSLATMIDRQRVDTLQALALTGLCGRRFATRLRGQLPPTVVAGRLFDAETRRVPRKHGGADALPASAAITLDTLATGDGQLQAAIDRARRIFGKDIPILIQGESGAGKEMFAKAFHHSGPRAEAPFVALNCAAIPENLIESELFGYQGGAFTGARKEGAPGKIQQAHGGTLFLDEIGDMPLNLQARLLRVLQERCVTPLGSSKAIHVDISLVCATHRRLRDEVARGTFREDLYYRLHGLAVTLPALRERTDIRVLVRKLANGERDGIGFTEGALRAIERYRWPGNIRQLNNVIRVAIALLDDGESLITESHLPEELFEAPEPTACPLDAAAHLQAAVLEIADSSLEELGRRAAQHALDAAAGNVSQAARQLGISRNTLYRKLGRL